MVIVGYYTKDTPYEKEAKSFIENVEEYDLEYKLYPIESKGSWVFNCGMKPRVLLQALQEIDDDILYTDIDSRFVRTPPFEEIQKDIPGFCICQPWHKEELLSGTMFFPNNELSKRIVLHWIEEQKSKPHQFDQKTLYDIVDQYDHFRLNENWVKIFDNQRMKADNPIIKHYQASRRYKGKV